MIGERREERGGEGRKRWRGEDKGENIEHHGLLQHPIDIKGVPVRKRKDRSLGMIISWSVAIFGISLFKMIVRIEARL